MALWCEAGISIVETIARPGQAFRRGIRSSLLGTSRHGSRTSCTREREMVQRDGACSRLGRESAALSAMHGDGRQRGEADTQASQRVTLRPISDQGILSVVSKSK